MSFKTIQDLLDNCDQDGVCQIWRGGVTSKGLPQVRWKGRGGVMVSRIIWTEGLGRPRPKEPSCIVPSCGRMRCVSMDCLHRTTRSKVMQLQWSIGGRVKQRAVSTDNLRALGIIKLDMQKAEQIRASGADPRDQARLYGVKVEAIRRILQGETYKATYHQASVFTFRP